MPSPVRSQPTQQYPSCALTVCVDLDAFSSDCSHSSDCPESDRNLISVSPVGIDWVCVSSVDSGDNGQTDVSLQLSRFQPLNRSPASVDISSD